MIILGVDQGLANFGYALLMIDEKSTNAELIDYGCFTTKPNGNQQKRIFELVNRFENLIIDFKPDYIAHERLFFSPPAKNSRKKSASILNTNMITGAMWYISGKYNVPVYEFAPPSVKKTLTGTGKAEKEDVIKTIEDQYKINCLKTQKEHICDAIAIALTCKEKLPDLLSEDKADVDEEVAKSSNKKKKKADTSTTPKKSKSSKSKSSKIERSLLCPA